MSVNHDLKQDKEFLALKSSIKLFQEKMNQSAPNNYQRQMTFEKKNPNPIQVNSNISNNQINTNSHPNINRTVK